MVEEQSTRPGWLNRLAQRLAATQRPPHPTPVASRSLSLRWYLVLLVAGTLLPVVLFTELHGSTVQVDSPGEGQGATFTVKLPLLAQVYDVIC